jgi:hypothetical protein
VKTSDSIIMLRKKEKFDLKFPAQTPPEVLMWPVLVHLFTYLLKLCYMYNTGTLSSQLVGFYFLTCLLYYPRTTNLLSISIETRLLLLFFLCGYFSDDI